MGKYNKTRNSSAKMLGFIIGLLFLLFGIFALVKPDVSVGILAVILFVCWGIRGILAYSTAPAGTRNGWVLVGGVLSLLVGVLFLFDISKMAPLGIVAEVFVGIWAMIMGVLRIINSVSFKKSGYTGIGWLLGSGIAIALLGLLLILFAGSAPLVSVTGVLIGIFMILFGIITVAETFTDRAF